MKHGLTETTVAKIHAVLARFPAVEKAVLYGSRAKGNFKPGSDIDLTLQGAALTSDLRSAIASALDDLLLPYTIDLSLFDELNHAKLREHIERVGVLFYQRAKQSAAVKKGWQRKNMGDVCDVVNGGTPKTGVAEYWDGSHLWITPAEMGKRLSPYVRDTERKITDLGLQNSSARMLPPHSVILSSRAPIGHLVINTVPMATNQGCKGLVPNKALHYKFLYYFLGSIVDFLNELGTGATFKELSGGKLKVVPIPLPPLPEQHRIVGILDEAFAGIAIAKANAEKNLQNARALFASHLQAVFTKRGKGWMEKSFEELLESNVIGLTKNSREQGEDKPWPYVKMHNITRNNRFDFSRYTCVEATEDEVRKFSLRNGDFLFNTRNSYELVGKSCLYESDSNDVVLFNNNIMRIRFKTGIDARFVLLAFSSEAVANELSALKSGTTNVSAIYFKDLKSLVIPVPPIAIQKSIAAKLDSLSTETQHLDNIYQQKLAALEELKKALLHQAFAGEL
jgi:type I restriction enzyme S subunit